MFSRGALSYSSEDALLATMHGKERVIAPLLERAMGLRVHVARDLDTDRFGTFSRDIARTGSQLDAARAKIEAAFEGDPRARVGIASEGSSGPHPQIPLLSFRHEIVVLIDRETGLELIGHHADAATNYGHAIVSDLAGATAFAGRVGFPDHGLIVIGCDEQRQPVPSLGLIKDVASPADLAGALERIVSSSGAAFVETDMRAHRNPTRMRAIKRATLDLVRRSRSLCPECNRPGFAVTECVPGLRCASCANPTRIVKAEVMTCAGCRFRFERQTGTITAEPGFCDYCNP